MDDLETEELRPDYPCPYCYEDYDIASLCSHLEDEHPSVDSRAAVRTALPSPRLSLPLLFPPLRSRHASSSLLLN